MTERQGSTGRVCKDFEADLVLYHYGDCAEPERRRVEAHVQSCPGCARYLRDLDAILPFTVKPDEPPQSFWLDYTRELRGKLARVEHSAPWWKRAFFARPWPALATALVLILALTLTWNRISRRPSEIPPEEQALLAVLPMAENLEFFKAMELLDALDLLEVSGGLVSGAA